jgi:hypothetical protein
LVYVSEGGRSQVYESGDKGAVNIDLQEGKYTISASMSEPEGDLMSRYASAEAHVGVVPNDSTSVILTLRSIDDPISAMSLSTLQKIGIADEISKYINN